MTSRIVFIVIAAAIFVVTLVVSARHDGLWFWERTVGPPVSAAQPTSQPPPVPKPMSTPTTPDPAPVRSPVPDPAPAATPVPDEGSAPVADSTAQPATERDRSERQREARGARTR